MESARKIARGYVQLSIYKEIVAKLVKILAWMRNGLWRK